MLSFTNSLKSGAGAPCRRWLGAVPALVATLVLTSCTGGAQTSAGTGTATPPPAAVTATPAPGSTPSGTPSAASQQPVAIHEFSIKGKTFLPAEATVEVQSVGLWTNSAEEAHTIVGQGWELGPIAPGQAWAHTFKANEVGTVTYRSKENPEMTGRIVVKPAGK